MKLQDLVEAKSGKYTPEQIIDAFTRMYKDSGDPLNGGECADTAYIYHYLNNKFNYVGLDGDEDMAMGHIGVEYKGKYYDGHGPMPRLHGEEYVPVKIQPGTTFFNSCFVNEKGEESYVGIHGGGKGEPPKTFEHSGTTVYAHILKYLEDPKYKWDGTYE